MTNNLVSIITPNYNSLNFFKETIQSVLNQSYDNWEWLITDDGSVDGSIALIEEICKKEPRVKLFKQINSGPSKARNNSIKNANGQYLAFLDSDDIWFSEFLSTSIENISNSEGFVFSSYKRCDEITLDEKYPDFIVPEKVNYKDILKTNSISCLTAFIDIKKLGKEFMPEVLYRQDMGLWLKYLKKIKYAHGIQEPLAIYRIRNNSHSRNKKKLLAPQWYFYRKVAKISCLGSLYYMIIWAYRGFKKYR